jgi:repressor LexA
MENNNESTTQKAINQRFGILVKELKKLDRIRSQSRLAEMLGVTQAQISALVQGVEGKNSTPQMLARMLQVYPEINPNWLMGLVDSPMFLEGNARSLGQPLEADFVDLPFVQVSLRASFTESIIQGTVPDIETIRVMYVPAKLYKKGMVFEVDGDSMEPNYIPGARVLALPVDPGSWEYMNSGVYAVCFGNSFVIKRVKDNTIMNEGILMLHSDNPSGGSMPLRVSDIRAIWKIEQIVYSPAR